MEERQDSRQAAGTLYVVSAPSGAGKTSLVRALVDADPQTSLSVSHTTRAARPGETDGVHYHFVDKSVFNTMHERGDFLEHANVFGNGYGTSAGWVGEQLADGIDVVLEIDWQEARQVRSHMGRSVGVFILPPSRVELERRLRSRGQDDDAVIGHRMAQAGEELSHWGEFDYLVVNDEFTVALENLLAIVRAQRNRRPAQAERNRELLAELLE